MGKMQNVLPWITWSWCYAHRLELACKTALTGTLFKDVEDMCGDCITNPQQPLIQLLFGKLLHTVIKYDLQNVI